VSLSARDASALHALLSLRGEDGWTRPRARGQILDASGLSWTTWRRAVGALVSAGMLEEQTGKPGRDYVSSVYRVTDKGTHALLDSIDAALDGEEAAQVGPGVAQVGGPGRPTSLNPPDALALSYLRDSEEKREHPEAGPRGPGWPAQVAQGGVAQVEARAFDVPAAICYLADVIARALSAAPSAALPAAAAAPRPPRVSLDHQDRRDWTGHDCAIACTASPAHGPMRPIHNAGDDSWFSRCTTCGVRYDPAVARRGAAKTADEEQEERATRPVSSLAPLNEVQQRAMTALRAKHA
jgi:hypothetical protein